MSDQAGGSGGRRPGTTGLGNSKQPGKETAGLTLSRYMVLRMTV
jgi:hypothetical protein